MSEHDYDTVARSNSDANSARHSSIDGGADDGIVQENEMDDAASQEDIYTPARFPGATSRSRNDEEVDGGIDREGEDDEEIDGGIKEKGENNEENDARINEEGENDYGGQQATGFSSTASHSRNKEEVDDEIMDENEYDNAATSKSSTSNRSRSTARRSKDNKKEEKRSDFDNAAASKAISPGRSRSATRRSRINKGTGGGITKERNFNNAGRSKVSFSPSRFHTTATRSRFHDEVPSEITEEILAEYAAAPLSASLPAQLPSAADYDSYKRPAGRILEEEGKGGTSARTRTAHTSISKIRTTGIGRNERGVGGNTGERQNGVLSGPQVHHHHYHQFILGGMVVHGNVTGGVFHQKTEVVSTTLGSVQESLMYSGNRPRTLGTSSEDEGTAGNFMRSMALQEVQRQAESTFHDIFQQATQQQRQNREPTSNPASNPIAAFPRVRLPHIQEPLIRPVIASRIGNLTREPRTQPRANPLPPQEVQRLPPELQIDLASTLLTFMRALNLPQDLQLQTEAALSNNDRRPEQSMQPVSNFSVPVFPSTIVNHLDRIRLDNDGEKLMKEGFKALIRDDAAEHPAMKFIEAYNKEGNEISPEIKENYRHLDPLLDQVWKDIYLKLVIDTSECYLDDNLELKRAMANVCRHLANSSLIERENGNRRILNTFKTRTKEVLQVASALGRTSKPVRAILASYAAAKLHQYTGAGEDSMFGLRDCVDFYTAFLPQLHSQPTLCRFQRDHLKPLLHDMINWLKASPGLSRKRRVENEAWCLFYSGLCAFGDHGQARRDWKSAIDLMETELDIEALHFAVYGQCLASYAAFQPWKEDIDSCQRAIDIFKKAQRALESANDWKSTKSKDGAIQSVKRFLKGCEDELFKMLRST